MRRRISAAALFVKVMAKTCHGAAPVSTRCAARRVITRYVARGTTFKMRDGDANVKFKRVRFRTYEMMRVRAP